VRRVGVGDRPDVERTPFGARPSCEALRKPGALRVEIDDGELLAKKTYGLRVAVDREGVVEVFVAPAAEDETARSEDGGHWHGKIPPLRRT
jgi:hypothetical protein